MPERSTFTPGSRALACADSPYEQVLQLGDGASTPTSYRWHVDDLSLDQLDARTGFERDCQSAAPPGSRRILPKRPDLAAT